MEQLSDHLSCQDSGDKCHIAESRHDINRLYTLCGDATASNEANPLTSLQTLSDCSKLLACFTEE